MTKTVNPTYVQQTHRFVSDDAANNSATLIGSNGDDASYAPGDTIRLRFLIEQATDGANTDLTVTPQLHYSYNGGSYGIIGGPSDTSFPIRVKSITNITDGNSTTQRIGSGTFIGGTFEDTASSWGSGATFSSSTASEAEFEIALEIYSGYPGLSNGDTIDLRIYRSGGTALNGGYTDTPRITVSISSVDHDYTGSGSITTSGSAATKVLHRWTYQGSGSLTTGGSATYYRNLDWSYSGSGSISTGGSATTLLWLYNEQTTLGLSGTPQTTPLWEEPPTGVSWDYTGSGSITTGGSATTGQTRNFPYTGSGSITTGGAATTYRTGGYYYTGSGSITTGGAATTSGIKSWTYSGSGSITTGGTATYYKTGSHYYTGSGFITTGGSASYSGGAFVDPGEVTTLGTSGTPQTAPLHDLNINPEGSGLAEGTCVVEGNSSNLYSSEGLAEGTATVEGYSSEPEFYSTLGLSGTPQTHPLHYVESSDTGVGLAQGTSTATAESNEELIEDIGTPDFGYLDDVTGYGQASLGGLQSITVIPTGGLTFGGTSDGLKGYIHTPTSGLTFGGTGSAKKSRTVPIPTAITITFNGSAGILLGQPTSRTHTPTGGITFNGQANVSFFKNYGPGAVGKIRDKRRLTFSTRSYSRG